MNYKTLKENPFRSGFVVIAGKPNAGKSTLLNSIADMKIAIVSEKPQTTRRNIMYIHNDDMSQIIFKDTPGLHVARNKLNEKMMEAANSAISDADLILLIVDSLRPEISEMELNICSNAGSVGVPVFLIINKVDLIRKENLLHFIDRSRNLYPFNEIFPISAKTGLGLPELMDSIRTTLPEGPKFFPEDTLTDQTERDIAGEYIRESVLQLTSDEIPHGTAVEIQSFEELTSGEDTRTTNNERSLVRIKAVIYCERDSHKKILIGRNGQTIKRIGTTSRIKIERMLDCKVFLDIFVKVRKDWRNDLPKELLE